MPQALLFVLGAIGAAIAAKLAVREWHRINDELDRAKAQTAPVDAGREGISVLRRDPVTGEYRPNR